MELKRGRRLLLCNISLFQKWKVLFFVSLAEHCHKKTGTFVDSPLLFVHVDFCSFFTRPLSHETSV